MNKCTIVVNTCDAYSDVWDLFFSAFNDQWCNCPFEIVINTEVLVYENSDIKTHNYKSPSNTDQWGRRLISTLEDIKTPYIFMLYDDYIVESRVDQDKIIEYINYIHKFEDISAIYLMNNPYTSQSTRFNNLLLINQKADYKLNSAPALWKREKLISYIEDYDTPWAWEFFGSYRSYYSDDLFYCVQKDNENIYNYNYTMGGAIYRGEWVRKVVTPLLEKYNLNIDINKRGVAESINKKNKRSLKWKIDFFILGYKMIGIGVFLYIFRIIKKKLGI